MEKETILKSVGFTIQLTDEEQKDIERHIDIMMKNNEHIGLGYHDFAYELMALGYHNGQAQHHRFMKWFKERHPYFYRYIMKRYER